jgi:hypothetical protein
LWSLRGYLHHQWLFDIELIQINAFQLLIPGSTAVSLLENETGFELSRNLRTPRKMTILTSKVNAFEVSTENKRENKIKIENQSFVR